MSWVDGLVDWIINNPAVFVSLIISVVLAFITVWAEIRKRKAEWLHLVPLCELRPHTSVSDVTVEGGKEFIELNANVEIYPHGGKILYQKFSYILTFKNSTAPVSGIARLIGATPVISRDRGGPWGFGVPKLERAHFQNIDYMYLAMECSDQLLREYFYIARFKYISEGWASNKIIFMTKRKWPWNKNQIELFKRACPKWIKKYGEKGKLVQDWSDVP